MAQGPSNQIRFKQFIYFLVLTIIIVPFQNCTLRSQALLDSPDSLFANKGNGETYEGKPEASFYRFIPNFQCNGLATAAQIVHLINGQVVLYDMKGEKCSQPVKSLTTSDLNFSPFQSDFVSIQDFLFKRYDNPEQGIPNNLAEVLCRDDFTNPSFEIIAHYDREKNVAQARVYSAQNQISDFTVSRILSMNDVNYVSDDLSFSIDFSKVVESTKRYAGQIKSSKISQITKNNVTCVIGGSLDTSNWSFKTVSEYEVDTFQVIPAGDIEFTSPIEKGLYNSVVRLFRVDEDFVTHDITKNTFASHETVWANYFVGNGERYTTMWVLNSYEYGPSWFLWDKVTDKIVRMTNIEPNINWEDWEASIYTTTMDTTQSNILIFSVFLRYPSRATILRYYDPADEKVHDILKRDTSVAFRALKKSKRLLLGIENLDGPVEKSLEYSMYDLVTKENRLIPIAVPTGCKLSGYRGKLLKDERTLLELFVCTSGVANRSIEIDLETGTIKPLIDDKLINIVSENEEWLLASADMGITDSALVNRITNKTYVTPIYSNYAFMSDDGNYFYGLGGKSFVYELYRLNLKTGQNEHLCQNAIGQRNAIVKTLDHKIYLLTRDDSAQMYRVFFVKESGECARVNEFPSEYVTQSGFAANQIGFSLNLLDSKNFKARESVFIPVDGRPPMKLSTTTEGVWQMTLSPSKNKIYILGPDTDGVRRIKLFSF